MNGEETNAQGQQESSQESSQQGQEEIKQTPEGQEAPAKPTVPYPLTDSPNAPLVDPATNILLDRRTGQPLRDQDPGHYDSDWLGKHDVNDVDDIADGFLKK